MESDASGTGAGNSPQTRRESLTPPWVGVVLSIAALSLTVAVVARSGGKRERGGDRAEVAYSQPRTAAGPTVSLAIDFGNGARHEVAGIAWTAGMTAGDVLHAASRISPGIDYQVRGSGAMALLTSLDGVANGAGDGRYWFYEIDGESGEVSFAVKPVAAGDRVLWIFKAPE